MIFLVPMDDTFLSQFGHPFGRTSLLKAQSRPPLSLKNPRSRLSISDFLFNLWRVFGKDQSQRSMILQLYFTGIRSRALRWACSRRFMSALFQTFVCSYFTDFKLYIYCGIGLRTANMESKARGRQWFEKSYLTRSIVVWDDKVCLSRE